MYSEEKPERTCNKCYYHFGITKDICGHPEAIKYYDVIRGDAIYTKCIEMRKSDGLCGFEGKLFEAKNRSNIIDYILRRKR